MYSQTWVELRARYGQSKHCQTPPVRTHRLTEVFFEQTMQLMCDSTGCLGVLVQVGLKTCLCPILISVILAVLYVFTHFLHQLCHSYSRKWVMHAKSLVSWSQVGHCPKHLGLCKRLTSAKPTLGEFSRLKDRQVYFGSLQCVHTLCNDQPCCSLLKNRFT